MTDIPAGFEPHTRHSPVTEPWEPIFAREIDGTLQLGLRIAPAHCNSRGFLHGGVIAALADNAMGLSYGAMLRRDGATVAGGLVTLTLTLDYVTSGRTGAWLEIRPRVIKAGRSIGFVDALVLADDVVLARASATFKLVGG